MWQHDVVQVSAQAPEEARILDEHRHRISLVLSESSPEGVEQYARGYIDRHGIPVMSFTWGINLLRHYPVPAATMASLVFLGSYFEKTTRIDAYFGEPFSKYTHSVVGYGWGDSPFDIADTMLDDFDATAPMLYSGHTVSLNIHHAYEEAGHTCNERSFNVPACGGFMISDNARRIRDFFPEDEAVLADGPADYHEKIDYFGRAPAVHGEGQEARRRGAHVPPSPLRPATVYSGWQHGVRTLPRACGRVGRLAQAPMA